MKSLLPVFAFVSSLSILHTQRLPQNDVILKVNGDELVVEVPEIGAATTRRSSENESLVYSFKKEDGIKIISASVSIALDINKNESIFDENREALLTQNEGVYYSPYCNFRDGHCVGN